MCPIPLQNLVTVMPGDTLRSLARRYLGDANADQTLYELNRKTIEQDFRAYRWTTLPWKRRYHRSQDYLRVGAVLRIPNTPPKPAPPPYHSLAELAEDFRMLNPHRPLRRNDMSLVIRTFLAEMEARRG